MRHTTQRPERTPDRARSIIVDGVTFQAVDAAWAASDRGHWSVRKTSWALERYQQLAHEFAGGNLVELGIDRGGSTALFALLFRPSRMMALDLSPEPVPMLEDFLRSHGLSEQVALRWGVDQADRGTVDELLSEWFGSDPLDLVVDDASHLLGPTRTSFELLFPRLRSGGVFVIEDWSHEHVLDEAFADVLSAGGAVAARLSEDIASAVARPRATPLSRLVLELVLITAGRRDVVTDMRLHPGFCEIVRGPASIDSSFSLDDHLGTLAKQVLDGTRLA